MRLSVFLLIAGCIPSAAWADSAAGDLQSAIAVLQKVGPNSQGNAEAAKAWQVAARAQIDQLPEMLAAMDQSSPLACNWLRSAIDQVLDRAKRDKQEIPREQLDKFLADTKHHPRARRLAYELITERDPAAKDRYLSGMADDPSPDLRRDAVALLLEKAEKLCATEKKMDALPLVQKCLACAREKDQIDKTVKRLRELGQTVDVPAHLGLIQDWKLIGPFSNAKLAGVETAFPPEKRFDPSAEYDGMDGKVRWQPYVTRHEYGLVNLNEALGKHKEAVAYALAEFTSAKDQTVDIRIGCFNIFKLWVNGELVLQRGDYFTGMKLDHYVTQARLKAGNNLILMKVCQIDPPAQFEQWQFQLRVCDAGGAAVLSTTRPKIEPATKQP